MKVNLKKISAKNFRSFDEFSIDIRPGLYALKGLSGAGKSNIHLAISYAFGYCPFPATELQNINQKEQFNVIADFSVDNEDWSVSRGSEHFLFKPSGKIEGARAVSSNLASDLKASPNLLETLCLRTQREKGRFLNLSDSEKKTFLSSVIGLDKLEEDIELSIKQLKDNEHSLKLFNSLKEQNLEKLHDIVDLKEFIVDKNILSELNKINEELDKLKDEINRANIEYQGYVLSEEKSHEITNKSNLDKLNTLILTISNQKKNILSIKKMIDNISNDLFFDGKTLDKLNKDLKKIDENKCYVCESYIKDSEKIRSELESSIQKIHEKIGNTKKILENHEEEYSRNLVNLDINVKEKESLDFVIQSNIPKIKRFEEFFPNSDNILNEIARYKTQAISLTSKWNEQQELLSNFIQKKNLIEFKKNENEKILNKNNQLDKQISALEKECNYLNFYIKLNKQFLTQIFNDILVEIETETNNILPKIRNVKDITFSFNLNGETLSGKEKNKIETYITKSGQKVSSKSGLSGGQFAALEFVVDLAVTEVISRRTNLYFNWLILDEPFDGLGTEEKEACLEYLKTYLSHKTIFVIDHSSEIKEWFDKFYQVEYNDSKSVILEVT